MKYTVGVDLGSTTTKAVVLNESAAVLGRGITNSRSNYEVACQVAMGEALINTRFSLLRGELKGAGLPDTELDRWVRDQGAAIPCARQICWAMNAPPSGSPRPSHARN